MDGSLLELSPLINLGGWLAVVTGVLLAVRKGTWIPGNTVQTWFGVYDQRIADLKEQNSELKAALKASNEARDLQAQSLSKLIPFVEAASDAMRAISFTAGQRRD